MAAKVIYVCDAEGCKREGAYFHPPDVPSERWALISRYTTDFVSAPGTLHACSAEHVRELTALVVSEGGAIIV